MLMKYLVAKTFVKPLLKSAAVLLLFSAPLHAENVYITGWKGLTANTNDHTPAPLSVIDAGFPNSGAGSSSASAVSPVPIIPNSSRRIHYGRSAGATWKLTPTNMVVTPVTPAGTGPYTFTALQNLGAYKIYLTKGQNNNASTNIIIRMTAEGGVLADTNGVGASEIFLDMYQKGMPNGIWVHVGYITNSIFSPTITLQHYSGDINDIDAANNNAQRWYTDAIRFEFVGECTGVADPLGVSGPLVNGQTFVTVTKVAPGATNVTIYANNSQIAQLTNYPGFLTNTLTITTPPLVSGQQISAGQIKSGCIGDIDAGMVVGDGPNSPLKVSLSCWQNSEFTGPVGSSTATNLTGNYFVKANGFVNAFGTALTGGAPLTPGDCWQTVTFDLMNDQKMFSNGSGVPDGDPYAALAGFVFSINSTNSGPYDLYIDEIKNGDVIIENFENDANGSVGLFAAPKTSSSPPPTSTYLTDPNSSTISQNNAFEGSKALRVQWQWVNGDNIRWAHVLATNSVTRCYPKLDTSKPVTVRYLLLAPGQTTNKLSFTSVPVNQLKSVGDSVTFSVQPRGVGPFTYQWSDTVNGPLAGETNSTYTKLNLQESDSGIISVDVTGEGGVGCTAKLSALLTVTTEILPPTLSYSINSGQITLTWNGSFTLQSRTNLSVGSWNDVTGTSGYSESLTSDSTKFFRLRQ